MKERMWGRYFWLKTGWQLTKILRAAGWRMRYLRGRVAVIPKQLLPNTVVGKFRANIYLSMVVEGGRKWQSLNSFTPTDLDSASIHNPF